MQPTNPLFGLITLCHKSFLYLSRPQPLRGASQCAASHCACSLERQKPCGILLSSQTKIECEVIHHYVLLQPILFCFHLIFFIYRSLVLHRLPPCCEHHGLVLYRKFVVQCTIKVNYSTNIWCYGVDEVSHCTKLWCYRLDEVLRSTKPWCYRLVEVLRSTKPWCYSL